MGELLDTASLVCAAEVLDAVRIDEDGLAGGLVDAHPPRGVVDDVVVVPAEEREVVDGCGPAVGPVDDVVRLAPGRRVVAAGEGAHPVARHDGAAQVPGNGA